MKLKLMNEQERGRFAQQRKAIRRKYAKGWMDLNDAPSNYDYRNTDHYKVSKVMEKVGKICLHLGFPRTVLEYFPESHVAVVNFESDDPRMNSVVVYVRVKDMEIRHEYGFVKFRGTRELAAWVREW